MAWPSCWRSAPLPLRHPTLLFLSTSSKPPRPDMPLRAVHFCHLHAISGPDLISLSDWKPLWLLLGQPLAHTSSPACAAGVILSNTNLIMSLHYFKLFPECWQYTHAHTQHTHIHKHMLKIHINIHTNTHIYTHSQTHIHKYTQTHSYRKTHSCLSPEKKVRTQGLPWTAQSSLGLPSLISLHCFLSLVVPTSAKLSR